MARARTVYTCSECGNQSPQWAGRCAACGAWNSLTEDVVTRTAGTRRRSGRPAPVVRLGDVGTAAERRTPTAIGELDRVLGGGLVAGSVVLIGGDPGIGKSTLLLQMMHALAQGRGVLYVTGEESLQQLGLRARRLGLEAAALPCLAETRVEAILAAARSERPAVLVVDSIQTVFTDELQSAPGSVAQVRETAARLVRFAKESDTALFLVGHVTKEGALAGPRVLEHMVDTVLYFEGDAGERYRVIRAVKNRFGAVNEIGVFAMTDKGLRQVANPSAIFISRHEEPVPGSVVMVTREGTRPMLVEVQALVDQSQLGNPRRVAVGLEHNRLAMLLAVLHRHAGVPMFDQDVFVNVVGGIRVTETASDLAVLLAALSSYRDKPLPADIVVFGEVGLGGEVRPVYNGEERLREAAKHGFQRAIVPVRNAPRSKRVGDLKVTTVTRLADVLDALN